MAKIVTIYDRRKRAFTLTEMSYIRWLKISEALAGLGHEVHIGTNEPAKWFSARKTPLVMRPNLVRQPLQIVNVEKYDVVKTLFHMGFETLEFLHGLNHPFIISKLGSVVASVDRIGIPFYGKRREQLFEIQKRIHEVSRYVTVLSGPAKELWSAYFPSKSNVLVVPGAADAEIPAPGKNPYPEDSYKKCIFAGNIYIRQVQAEANRILSEKLNSLGKLLLACGIRLYMIGTGDIRRLNPDFISYLGAIPYEQSWDFLHHANAGVVLNPDAFLHNNESSKIYHYLRAGLPVVVEQGFPNEVVVTEAALGFISENGNMRMMAELVDRAIRKRDWDREGAMRYILKNHTWERRALIYDELIKRHFA